MPLQRLLQHFFRNDPRRASANRRPSPAPIRLDNLEDRLTPAIGSVQFQLGASSFAENAASTVAIQLVTNDTNLNNPVSVDVTNSGTQTATSGADYTAFPTTTLTYTNADPFVLNAVGDRVYTKTVSVSLIDDLRVEANETVAFALGNLVVSGDGISIGGPAAHSLTITDNDSATVSVAAGTTTVAEGGGSQNVTATLTLNTTGSGTEGLDVAISANLPGNADYSATGVTFAVGSVTGATANIAVTATDDRFVEAATESHPGQALTITSTGGANVTASGSRTIDVTDNDSATVSIAAGTTTVAEGGGSENIVATLTLTTTGSGTEQLAVPVRPSRIGNADFTAVPANFAAGATNGATANIAISAVDDLIVEGTETFPGQALLITANNGASVTASGARDIVVTDNDTATVTFAAASSSAGEGTTAAIGVTLTITGNGTPGSGTLGSAVTVDLAAAPAGFAADISLPASPAVTFAAGASSGTQNASVGIVDDRLVEANETFTLSLTNLTGPAGVSAGTGTHALTATDNESATVSVAAGTTTVAEGATQNVVATLAITSVGSGAEELAVPISVNLPGNADYSA